MTPFEYISTHVYVKLKPSKVQGVGVFAIRDIPSGIDPFAIWEGASGTYSIEEDLLILLPKEVYSHVKDMFTYSPNFPEDTNTYVRLVNGFHWIYQNPYYFINSGFSKANVDKDTLLTTRHIRKGEELLSNYGRYERFSKKELI